MSQSQAKSDATVAARCKNCNHTGSFHKGGTDRCYVVGCDCKKWVGPKAKKPTAKR